MSAAFEELRVLQTAEQISDALWKQIIQWGSFAQDTVGKQLARAADSIGANIAESFGRFHFGEKLQFLYFARGSLFETKYWLNRVLARGLMPTEKAQDYISDLTKLARELNAFAAGLKGARSSTREPKTIKESVAAYAADTEHDVAEQVFTAHDLEWLAS